jgi:integrase
MPKRIKQIVYQENLYSVYLRKDTWYVQYKDPNSKKYLVARSLKLNLSSGMTRFDAEKRAEELLKQGIVDKLIISNRQKDSLYFSGFAKDFFAVEGKYHHYRMSEGRSLRESTLDGYRGNLELYIDPFFKDFLLKEITRKHALAFRSYLLVEKRLDPQSAKNIYKNFKAIIKYALQEELIFTDCTSGISIVVPKKQKASVLSTLEVQKLWSCTWQDQRVRLATLLAALTGARRGEVLALTWKDLNLENNEIRIHHSWNSEYGITATKNGDERNAFITTELAKEFKEYREQSPCNEDTDYVFPSTINGKKPLDAKRLDAVFHKALESIGITEDERKTRRITFHNLRHRLITILHEQGVSPLTIRAMVGHSDDRIEYCYYHGRGEEVIPILSSIFSGLPSKSA